MALDAALEAVGLLMAGYPEITWEEPTIRLYQRMLKDLPDELLLGAVEHLIATNKGKYPPRISEIRDTATDLIEQAAGIPDAYQAWESVQRWLKDFNPHRASFGDDLPELTSRAVRMVGGWAYLYRSEMYAADRARFLEAYEILRQQWRDQWRLIPSTKVLIKELRQQGLKLIGGGE